MLLKFIEFNISRVSTIFSNMFLSFWISSKIMKIIVATWELDCEESWALKNWCFWTVVLDKTLESPLDCKEIQPVRPEDHPGCSLEGLMLKLKLQYFGHLMQRADSFAKILKLGKIEGRRRRGRQRMKWLDGITDTMDIGLGGLQELVMDRATWRAEFHGVAKSQTRLSDWTEFRKTIVSTTDVELIYLNDFQHKVKNMLESLSAVS